jgi:hypothetical protein
MKGNALGDVMPGYHVFIGIFLLVLLLKVLL